MAALVACTGSGEELLDAESARRFVLEPGDVPAVFERFDYGPIASADLPVGARADPARFGREQGWKARYRRSGTSETRGPLVIESLADVFDEAEGAEDELAAIRRELETPTEPVVTPLTPLTDPDVGDEAVAWSALVPAQPRNTVFFTVAWRDRNVVATVSVNGFEGRLALDVVLAFARKQQARVEAAD
jgi:hypothetical protein